MALTIRQATLADSALISTNEQRFQLFWKRHAPDPQTGLVPDGFYEFIFSRSQCVVWIVLSNNQPAGYVVTLMKDGIVEVELLRQFPLVENGVDADGDPKLTQLGSDAFGRLINDATTYWKARGLKEGRFTVTPKMWTRIQQLLPAYNIPLTLVEVKQISKGQYRVRVKPT